jgi:hypothetical protein
MSSDGLRIAAFAIAFRAFSAALAFVSNVIFPDYSQQFPSVFGGPTRAFWDSFVRFDSGWYFEIARSGYHYTPEGRDSIAFFPAYPLLMRHVGRLFGPRPSDIYFGGLVVSWVAFALAIVGVYYLARLDLPERRAARAAVLAAIFPFAFFFGAVYTEALFLACVVGAFYFFRTRRWLVGGLCGAVATATRPNGILMWPALAWLAWRTLSSKTPEGAPAVEKREWTQAALGLLLVGAGVGAFSAFTYRFTGSPFEWAAAIQRWGYYPGGAPWVVHARLVGALLTRPVTFISAEAAAPFDLLNGLTALLVVAAIPFVWRRLGAAYGLFMAVNLWLPLSSGQYEGLGRYCAVMFPFFIWLASIPSRVVFTSAVAISALLYTLCMTLFTNGYPLF